MQWDKIIGHKVVVGSSYRWALIHRTGSTERIPEDAVEVREETPGPNESGGANAPQPAAEKIGEHAETVTDEQQHEKDEWIWLIGELIMDTRLAHAHSQLQRQNATSRALDGFGFFAVMF